MSTLPFPRNSQTTETGANAVSAALPDQGVKLPDLLPARMVNEFVYCPRLFYYEWVDALFAHSADTIEGATVHKRVDRAADALPLAAELSADEQFHTRSLTLSSATFRVIAKLDLAEADGGKLTPVDYKRGGPTEFQGLPAAWPADRVQVVLQAMLLQENGYECDEAVIYYAATKQRVRISVGPAQLQEVRDAVQGAWNLAASGAIPAPLEDSPKCPRCSLVGICLPDETNALLPGASQQLELFDLAGTGYIRERAPRKPAAGEGVRRLIAPRTPRIPLYVNTQGLKVGKSGEVLQVKEGRKVAGVYKDTVVQEVRLRDISQLNLMGNIQVTTQTMQALFEAEIPVCYFSQGGGFYGIAAGLNTKNIFLRQKQFRLADRPEFCLNLARKLVAGKIRNQRTMLMRNHLEPPKLALDQMKTLAEQATEATALESLLGIEGVAARHYFQNLSGMLKNAEEDGDAHSRATRFGFDFDGRNRRPPRDPVNALLSLAYSILAKELTIACFAVGFDPLLGFYHQPRFGRPALALDLMEPFRPLIADSAVLTAVNTGMVTLDDFVYSGGACALKPAGRKGFFRAMDMRFDQLVTHPLFDYKLSYRRLLEVQVRLLARVIEGEVAEYPVFTTR